MLRWLGRVGFAVALAGPGGSQQPEGSEATVTVHEWGTFTSVAGEDGVSEEWWSFDQPADLPGFVYKLGSKWGPGARARVRMETPVLYFYADRETTLSARVRFPQGRITEWYPVARPESSGLAWPSFDVLPGRSVELPRHAEASHYYAARETDAALLRAGRGSGAQFEKFLFYRGVGDFELPLDVKLEGNALFLTNRRAAAIPWALVFENRGGEIGYRVLEGLGGPVLVDRPILGESRAGLFGVLARALEDAGLYPREADAMIRTWEDSWLEEGTRVFYILPRRITDALLPIEIDPQPCETVRVLVGRTEVLTPEREENTLNALASVDPARLKTDAERREIRRQLGRFAVPLLRRLLPGAPDAQSRGFARALLRDR